jgi:hypothetical protein
LGLEFLQLNIGENSGSGSEPDQELVQLVEGLLDECMWMSLWMHCNSMCVLFGISNSLKS